MNSTVNINTDAGDFGADFVYEDVYIITNYHVVYNAKDIKVVTYNKEEYKGSLVGYDSENDIAVLKINKKLKSMVLGDSEKVKTGDTLTAIGNPNGDLSFSKAEGKVLDVNPELLDMVDKNRKFIWYDGDAISGYSGGPVYDTWGRTIGILNARYYGDLSKYGYDKLCLIIPINNVEPIISNIIENS